MCRTNLMNVGWPTGLPIRTDYKIQATYVQRTAKTLASLLVQTLSIASLLVKQVFVTYQDWNGKLIEEGPVKGR